MLRNYHADICNLMHSLGYQYQVGKQKDEEGGVCHGLTMMGINACAIGEIDKFNDRILNLPNPADFQSKLSALHERIKQHNNTRDAATKPKYPLTKEDEAIIDILAFLDGVVLHQTPVNYYPVFSKSISQGNDETISDFTNSKKLVEKGGLEKVISWPGIYTDGYDLALMSDNELKKHIIEFKCEHNGLKYRVNGLDDKEKTDLILWSELSKDFPKNDNDILSNKNKLLPEILKLTSEKGHTHTDDELEQYSEELYKIVSDVKTALSIVISSDNHIIAIHYNSDNRQWYLIDSNQLPVKPIIISNLKNEIKKSLFETSHITAFNSAVYTLKNQANQKKLVTQIKKSPALNKLRSIDKNKASYTNCRNITLALIAAKHGHPDVMKALKEAGANLNIPDNNGTTPAFMVAQNGYADVMKVLAEAGADLNMPRNDGVTPALIAATHGHADVIKALKEAGANLNTPNNNGVTPAFMAAQQGHADVMKVLAEAGADLNTPDNNGVTPAFMAAQEGHADVMKVLAEAGTNLNIPRNDGATPALMAAYNKHVNVLIELDNAGVNLLEKTPLGTPLEIAIRCKATDCIVFLENYAIKKAALSQQSFLADKPNTSKHQSSNETPTPNVPGK